MRKIALIGGTGFVGRHLLNNLTKSWRVRLLTRQRERHRELWVVPNLEIIETDVYHQTQLNTNLTGCQAVINLVGILNEPGHDGSGFQRAHVELPQKLTKACQINRISRFIHLSALHADQGHSHYLRTKAEGERIIHAAAGLQATSFRPSVIFGEDDSFFNRFIPLLSVPSPIFMLPSGHTRFAPVWVEDVVEAILQSLEEPKHYGQRYNLCGPKIYTLKELVKYAAKLIGVKRWVIPLNDKLSYFSAKLLEFVPGKPYSVDNYYSSKLDSVCTENHLSQFVLDPHAIEEVMPKYFGPLSTKASLYSQFRSYAHR